MSCMLDCIHDCVFLLSKNCFEKLAQHLLDTLLSIELFKHFSYRNPDSSSIPCYLSSFSNIFFKRNLDTSSIPGGSIEKAPASSIIPRHLLDRSRFFLDSDFLLLDSFLDTSAIKDQFLDTYLDRYLDTSRYLHLSRFTSCLYKASVRSRNHFSSISLSIHLCFSPTTLSSSPNLFLKDSSSFFQVSPYLVSS